MGQRSEELATRFEQVIDDIIREVESASEEKWAGACGHDGWTMAATAHHVAAQWPLETEYLDAASAGAPPPTHTWDDINQLNDRRAAEHANVGKADVIQALRDGRARMGAYVRALNDGQLDMTAPLALADGAEVSTQQLIEGGVLIDHAASHLAEIRATG
jgi:hypothetical protein